MIDAGCEVFISVSQRPGRFGTTIYNSLFKANGMNAVYIPRIAGDPGQLITALRALDVRGCSVSMPLKKKLLPYLDRCEDLVERTGAVNTIVQKEGVVSGFNTDYFGFKSILERPPSSALIYGVGGVAGTIACVLKDLGCHEIYVSARRQEATRDFARSFQLQLDTGVEVDLFVNATPASVSKGHGLEEFALRARKVIDLVVSPTPVPFVRDVIRMGKPVLAGIEMCKYQLQRQYAIYTKREIEIKLVEDILSEEFLITSG